MGKVTAEPSSPIHDGGFFTGYSTCVWLIVVLGTFNGLAISVTLKYLDNIVVIFSHALAMIVVAVVSAQFFGLSLSGFFICGGALVIIALWMFYSSKSDESFENAFDRSDGSGHTAETQP